MFAVIVILVGMMGTALLYYRLERQYGFGWALLGAISGFLMLCGLLSVSSVNSFESTPLKAIGVVIFPILYFIVIIICMVKLDKEEPDAK